MVRKVNTAMKFWPVPDGYEKVPPRKGAPGFFKKIV